MRGKWMLAALALLVAVGPTGASAIADRGSAGARAFAVRIVPPGEAPFGTEAATAPGDSVSFGSGYAFPADGSSVATGGVTASALTSVGSSATGQASSEVTGVSLFGGEITAERVTVRARASAGLRSSTRDVRWSALTALVVLGQPVVPAANLTIPLGDWGSLVVLQGTGARGRDRGAITERAMAAGLEITLTADHAGLSAGTRVTVGYAEANARGPEPAPTPPPAGTTASPPPSPAPAPAARTGRRATPAQPRAARQPKPPEPRRSPYGVPPVRTTPQRLTPRLTAGGYVFPVYGPSTFTDTFGAPRASVGWHHGEDIFAPLGTPVLAVTDGTVFSVGWNDLGGNRLWLRDRQGNQFYYAHLSAFSPLAVNGARVNAGAVLGFVGDTGDAAGTPYHLHFEVHPVSLLGLGYDGAVNPAAYLTTWRHATAIDLTGVGRADSLAGFAARGSTGAAAPRPGAILLHVSDISSASGLDPGSLRNVLADRALAEGDGSFLARAGSPGLAAAGAVAPPSG